ncbi:response regulator [Flavobacteriaceae bacterium]|nr:response regulator [Flavobacteriaceae bacterium]
MITILYIEDDSIEQLKFKKLVQKEFPEIKLYIKSNGEEGLVFLKQMQEKINLIILDLNMPKVSGFEFLELNHFIKVSRVVVVTSSSNDRDMERLEKMGATAYFVKPLRLEEYNELLKSILTFYSKNKLL